MLRSMLAVGLAAGLVGVAHAGSPEKEGNGIVAPSEYVEDIETPGDTGGVMDEVDSAEAQAEAAEAAAKKAKKAQPPSEGSGGGW